jgi:hypothetical protein
MRTFYEQHHAHYQLVPGVYSSDVTDSRARYAASAQSRADCNALKP